MRDLRSFYLTILTFLLSSGAISQVDDGIYIFPDTNQYLAILTNNDIVSTYLFRLDGTDSFWDSARGSRIQDRIEIAPLRETVSGFSISASALGISMSLLYCNTYPLDGSDCSQPPVSGFPVIKANGNLKAIYRTQYGADFVVFESDGVGILLAFEYQEDLTDKRWIGAYTGILTDELTFTAQETAAESIPSEGEEFTLEFNLQISDLTNPQASFVNFSCIDNRPNPSERGCEYLEEIYFSKLIRVF